MTWRTLVALPRNWTRSSVSGRRPPGRRFERKGDRGYPHPKELLDLIEIWEGEIWEGGSRRADSMTSLDDFRLV